MVMRRWLAMVSLLMLVLSVAPPVRAETPTPLPPPPGTVTDDQVNAVAKKLYCPVCENIPLDTCGTKACEEWRELIRRKLAEGWTEEQILDYFVERYGERVLAQPRPKGVHTLVYVLPPVFIVAGVFILWRTLKTWRTLKEEAEPEAPAVAAQDLPEDPYLRQLEEELRNRL